MGIDDRQKHLVHIKVNGLSPKSYARKILGIGLSLYGVRLFVR